MYNLKCSVTLLLHAVSPAVNDMLPHFKASGHFLRMKIFAGFYNPVSLLLVGSTRDELSSTFIFLSPVLVNPIFMTVSVLTLILMFLPKLYFHRRIDRITFCWCRLIGLITFAFNQRE